MPGSPDDIKITGSYEGVQPPVNFRLEAVPGENLSSLAERLSNYSWFPYISYEQGKERGSLLFKSGSVSLSPSVTLGGILRNRDQADLFIRFETETHERHIIKLKLARLKREEAQRATSFGAEPPPEPVKVVDLNSGRQTPETPPAIPPVSTPQQRRRPFFLIIPVILLLLGVVLLVIFSPLTPEKPAPLPYRVVQLSASSAAFTGLALTNAASEDLTPATLSNQPTASRAPAATPPVFLFTPQPGTSTPQPGG